MGTIYLSGYLTVDGMMCGKRNANNSDCDFTNWNPNTEMLIVGAHGAGRERPARSSRQQRQVGRRHLRNRNRLPQQQRGDRRPDDRRHVRFLNNVVAEAVPDHHHRPARCSRATRTCTPSRIRRAATAGSTVPADSCESMSFAAAGLAFFPALAIGSFLNVVAARVPLQALGRLAAVGLHELRHRALVARQHPCRSRGCSCAAAAAPARPRSRGATRPSSWRRRCSSPPASGSSGSRCDAAIASFFCASLVVALGDRHRPPDHPEQHRPAGRRDRARREHASSTRRFEWHGRRLRRRALPARSPRSPTRAGMGMGDVKLALLLGVAVGRYVPIALFVGHALGARARPRALRPPRHGGPQDGDPLRAVPGPRRRSSRSSSASPCSTPI